MIIIYLSFEYFLCFHRTLGISPKDLEGFKADNHLHDARLLADDLNFDLTFVTRNFIGFVRYQMCDLIG